MPESDSAGDKIDSKSKWLPPGSSVLVLIVIVPSLANQFGFWRIFHVAILEHIGIADIPRLATWSLISALLGFAIGVIAGPLLLSPRAGQQQRTRTISKRVRFWVSIQGFAMMVFGVIAAFTAPPEIAGGSAAVLIGGGIGLAFTHPVKLPFVDFEMAPLLISWAVMIVGIAYGSGTLNAIRIRDGKEYLLASFPHKPQSELRYLARAGDHVFLYDPAAHATILYELKDVEPLTLTAVNPPIAHPQ
jgi:hypothetical protein